MRPQDVERTGDNPDSEIPDILERKTGSNQRLSHWHGGCRASGSSHLRHPVIRFSVRLIDWDPSASAAGWPWRQWRSSIGSVVWPAPKAQAGGGDRRGPRVDPLSTGSSRLGTFGWLASTTPPATWARLAVPSGLGTLSTPPRFRTVEGDPGTLSVALRSSVTTGTYLRPISNVTPRQGNETLARTGPHSVSPTCGTTTFHPSTKGRYGDSSSERQQRSEVVRHR